MNEDFKHSNPANSSSATEITANSLLTSVDTPVTVFSLSWCSFCHAAKQLLSSLDIQYTEHVLDRGPLSETQLNGRLRRELTDLTSSRTLPQVFVGSINIGGYTETLAAARNGKLEELLKHE
jgi:glutaredoxin